MSSVKLQGNASGTGSVTLASPNISTNLTFTLPSADGASGQAAVTNGSGTLSFGGTTCQAWVNFAGTTGTRNASYNVSSVTRNGAGDYTVNFTNALTDANYSSVVSCGGASQTTTNSYQIKLNTYLSAGNIVAASPTTTSQRFFVGSTAGGVDNDIVCYATFR